MYICFGYTRRAHHDVYTNCENYIYTESNVKMSRFGNNSRKYEKYEKFTPNDQENRILNELHRLFV